MIEISFTTAAHEAGAAGADSADASANGLTDAGTVPLDGFASDGTDSVDSWVDSADSWADWGSVADAAALADVADWGDAWADVADAPVWADAAVSAATWAFRLIQPSLGTGLIQPAWGAGSHASSWSVK